MNDQDWLDYQEGLASHQLEYEEWQAEQRQPADLPAAPFEPEWCFDNNDADGKLIITVITWTPQGDVRTEIALDYQRAVTFAHSILSEVEISHCSVCNDQRIIAIAGPDENGQYDTDDCPACSQPMVCECELDWNCPLHQGGPTAIERINHDWASQQTEIDRQNGM